jgi:hypothetical protein
MFGIANAVVVNPIAYALMLRSAERIGDIVSRLGVVELAMPA